MRPLALLAAPALTLLLACGGDQAAAPAGGGAAGSGATRLRLMTMQLSPRYDAYMGALCASFEAQNPGVEVEWIDSPFEGYLNRVQALFRAGEAPDVINLTYDTGVRIAQDAALADLGAILGDDVVATYFPGVVASACTWEGRVFALPWYLSVDVMMYNRSLMEQAGLDPDDPPETLEELLAASRQIRERLPGKFGFFQRLTEEGRLRELLARAGVPLVTRDERGRLRAAFNTPEGVAALEMWARAYQEGLIPRDTLTADHRRAIELFKTGTTVFFNSGPQFLREVRADAPDVYAVTGVASEVRWPNGLHFVEVHELLVPDRGDTPEAEERERLGAELAAFITSGPIQLALCREAPILPSVVAAAGDPMFTETDGTVESRARALSAAALASAEVFIPSLPEAGRLNAAMTECVQRACLGEATPAQALADAAARWDAIFESLDAAQ